jgi:hypothetical protein
MNREIDFRPMKVSTWGIPHLLPQVDTRFRKIILVKNLFGKSFDRLLLAKDGVNRLMELIIVIKYWLASFATWKIYDRA